MVLGADQGAQVLANELLLLTAGLAEGDRFKGKLLQLRALFIQDAVMKHQAIAVEPGNGAIGVRTRSLCRAQEVTLSQRVNRGVAPEFGLAQVLANELLLLTAGLAEGDRFKGKLLQLRALFIQDAVMKHQAIAVEPGNGAIGVRTRSLCRAQEVTLSQRVNRGVAPEFGLARGKAQRG